MEKTIFYVPDIQQTNMLTQEEANHCVRVLRKKEDDEILITDGKGCFFDARIVEAHAKHCRVELLKTIEQPKGWGGYLHIAFAPTKNMDRVEWFAEKATEIGIDELSPIRCRYSERKEVKDARIEKILVSAMKQSQKATLPKLNEMITFSEFVKQPFQGHKLIAHCYEDDTKQLLKNAYRKDENVLILIGPEGDFSEQEVAEAKQNGYKAISLGDSRLRAETAAVVACNTVQIINQ